MGAQTIREVLATALAAAVPDGWAVYAAPSNGQHAIPCVVIGPRSPYREWSTFGRQSLNLRLTLMVPRTDATALDDLDTALDLIEPAVFTIPNMSYETASDAGPATTAGGPEVITAAIDCTVMGVS